MLSAILLVVPLALSQAQLFQTPPPFNQFNQINQFGQVNQFTNSPCNSQMQDYVSRVCAAELQAYGIFNPPSTQPQSPNALTWDNVRRRSINLFQQICTAFENWDRCVTPYKDACFNVEPIKSQYTVTHEALAYVCRPPAIQDLTENWQCLLQASTRSDLVMCETQIMADARGSGGGVNIRDNSYACGTMQEYVGCLKKPIFNQCGNRTWSHVREAFQRPVRVYLPYCTLAGATSVPSVVLTMISFISALLLFTL